MPSTDLQDSSRLAAHVKAVSLLTHCRHLLVFSGAGLSRASGIPTYRDVDGLWTDPENLPYSEVRNLAKDPAGFIGFWKRRRADILQARPNAGHLALAQLQQGMRVTHVTQNVDGLLQKAGACNVLELHGNLRKLRCQDCSRKASRWHVGWRCWRCGGYLRPEVVLFGELLEADVLDDALQAASSCQVVLVVGTYGSVYPATRVLETASRFGAKTIVVNPSQTLLGDVADVEIRLPAEEVLPNLVQDALTRRLAQ